MEDREVEWKRRETEEREAKRARGKREAEMKRGVRVNGELGNCDGGRMGDMIRMDRNPMSRIGEGITLR